MIPFSIFFIAVGIMLTFLGNRFKRITLFLVGFFTGFGILISILGEFVIDP